MIRPASPDGAPGGPAGPTPAARARAVVEALPPGAVALAAGYWSELRVAVGERRPPVAAAKRVARRILEAPVALEPDWPAGTDPLPVGDGAVHADLIDDDRDALARLRSTLTADGVAPDPETLATEAQRWRLPVTPYRARPAVGDRTSPAVAAAELVAARLEGGERSMTAGQGLDEALVVDLSALWAGPLATSLLAEAGARVVKVDPECRPDGLRDHPRFHRHLNGGKEVVDLDLRRDEDRSRFEGLVARADLVLDSFSRRVMPNLGYGPDELRAVNPSVATLSIVAFPAGEPEADWVAYGPGVHATSGLADTHRSRDDVEGPGRFRPAPIAYPDPLAGLAAAAIGAGLMTGPRPCAHREVSLLDAIRPLLAFGGRAA